MRHLVLWTSADLSAKAIEELRALLRERLVGVGVSEVTILAGIEGGLLIEGTATEEPPKEQAVSIPPASARGMFYRD